MLVSFVLFVRVGPVVRRNLDCQFIGGLPRNCLREYSLCTGSVTCALCVTQEFPIYEAVECLFDRRP